MTKLFKRIQPWLTAMFPYFYVTTNVLLLLETVTYHGFVRKYLFSDISLFVYGTVALHCFLVSQSIFLKRKIDDRSYMMRLVIALNRLSLIPLILTYYVLANLEINNFPNYVFSHFHINPDNLMSILVLNLLVFGLELLRSTNLSGEIHLILRRRFGLLLTPQSVVQLLFFGSIMFFMVPQLQYDFNYTYINTVRTLQSLRETPDQKMILMLGGKKYTGWVYIYAQFLKSYTPSDAVLFIPPQTEGWQMEGNQYYFRWFVYPRKLTTSQDIEAPIPDDASYVAIAEGAWPWGMKEFGWPRIKIPAERIAKIILIDRETEVVTEQMNVDYVWDPNKHLWGVIKLKH